MGNTFFLRLQTIPAIATYFKQLEDIYEHQKQKNKIFKLTFNLCKVWFLIARFVISPVCAKFEAKVFNFDDFACKCLDRIHPALNSAMSQLHQISLQNLLQLIYDKLHNVRFYFPISLPISMPFGRQIFRDVWSRILEFGRHDKVYHLVTTPKRFVVSAYTYATDRLGLLEVAWIASISNFVSCLPHSINLPCRDFLKMVPWLCVSNKSEMVIGYVPIHPDDLNRLWQNRLFTGKNGVCWSYATR